MCLVQVSDGCVHVRHLFPMAAHMATTGCLWQIINVSETVSLWQLFVQGFLWHLMYLLHISYASLVPTGMAVYVPATDFNAGHVSAKGVGGNPCVRHMFSCLTD